MYLADRIGISLSPSPTLSLYLLFTCAQIENGILIVPPLEHERPQGDTHVSPAYPHLFSKIPLEKKGSQDFRLLFVFQFIC